MRIAAPMLMYIPSPFLRLSKGARLVPLAKHPAGFRYGISTEAARPLGVRRAALACAP